MSRRPQTPRDGTHGGRALALVAVVVVIALLALRHTGGTAVTTAGSARTVAPKPVTSAAPSTTAPASTSTTAPPIPPNQVKVLVLNGTGSGSLAGQTRSRLAAIGYNALAADDTTSTVTASAIYAVSAQYLGAADALALQVGLPASGVATPVPTNAPIKASERALADVVIVIGPGFTVPPASTTVTSTSSGATGATGTSGSRTSSTTSSGSGSHATSTTSTSAP